jgi:hypothetical protein
MTRGSGMPSAEAHVQTSSAGRYLARLCQHAGKMGRPQRHRPRAHGGSGEPPEVLRAECSETEGAIVLSWGRCALTAGPGSLTLRADAADEENLARIQDMIAGRLAKFGRRENLSVTWRPVQAEIP